MRAENKRAVDDDDDDVECHRKLDGRNEFSFHAEVRKKNRENEEERGERGAEAEMETPNLATSS